MKHCYTFIIILSLHYLSYSLSFSDFSQKCLTYQNKLKQSINTLKTRKETGALKTHEAIKSLESNIYYQESLLSTLTALSSYVTEILANSLCEKEHDKEQIIKSLKLTEEQSLELSSLIKDTPDSGFYIIEKKINAVIELPDIN